MEMNPRVARGRVVAAGRMLAGLDQAELATAAGLSASTVSKIERGKADVREATLEAVRDALERLGVDLTRNGRTGLHAAATCYA